MTADKLFVDSDILLDFLLDRLPFAEFSQALISRGEQGKLKLHSSTLILANVHYLVSKNLNKDAAITAVKYLMNTIEILPFEAKHINSAIAGAHNDFEDSVQYYIAKQAKCNFVISRNIKHYKKFDIPVLTAEQFLRTL